MNKQEFLHAMQVIQVEFGECKKEVRENIAGRVATFDRAERIFDNMYKLLNIVYKSLPDEMDNNEPTGGA